MSTFAPLITTIARAHLVTGSAVKEFPFPRWLAGPLGSMT